MSTGFTVREISPQAGPRKKQQSRKKQQDRCRFLLVGHSRIEYIECLVLKKDFFPNATTMAFAMLLLFGFPLRCCEGFEAHQDILGFSRSFYRFFENLLRFV